MKIYTKTGDQGKTGLFGGGRVQKNHPRVEAYGAVDELNAALGLVRALASTAEHEQHLSRKLEAIQNDLFVLGADLASPPDSRAESPRIQGHSVADIESEIDRLDAALPELKNFVLPAGSVLAAALHLARTIARRAERSVVTAAETDDVSSEAIVYLNRLSDLLFVMARWVEHASGRNDVLWSPKSPR